jgi:hydrogenase nickel incorporation protein HypB
MCGHCGCGDERAAAVLNLDTGKKTPLARDAGRQAHGDGHSHDHGHDDGPGHEHDHDHIHADGSRHSHSHGHVHAARSAAGEVVELEARILAKNEAIAERNRAWFKGREVLALNLMSSPGAGKTTLLERTIRDLKDELKLYVVEGDQETARDGARIRAVGAPAVQVNTGSGCHLDADMIERSLKELKPAPGSVLMIENVGNLVCPALFDLGERAKVVILSVTEGDDKPLKYPHMFKAAAMMVVSKIDLLPYVDFDPERALAYARQINPSIASLRLSARTGEGLDAWYDWLRDEWAQVRDLAFS